MKQIKLFAIIAVLLLIGLVAITSFVVFTQKSQRSFYVGVTYCGGSVEEAKESVDRVKDYTNLFVLMSGVLQWNITAMEEIGDYVITSGLDYAVYGGTRNTVGLNVWLIEAKERWSEHFIGIYYNDELGGDMLDDYVVLEKLYTHEEGGGMSIKNRISKEKDGTISFMDNNGTNYTYYPDGNISMTIPGGAVAGIVDYYPDGTFTAYKYVFENNRIMVYTFEDLTQFPLPIPTYETVLKQNPIQNNDDAAKLFINKNKEALEDSYLNKTRLSDESILVFTADYGLYWWDYKSGYDVVLAELAWNNSVTQEIGLVRGAASLQNKQWGTILTWKYTHPPYLTDGNEMFEHLKISYEAGAEYVLIFNYSEDPANPNTLQDEHFLALERFWTDVVQNPEVSHGGIKAEAVLVMPTNYGWGMRAAGDNIWGLWSADDTTQKLWDQLQDKLNQYGPKLDIVFDDPTCLAWNYKHIYYWNQK